MKALVAHRFGAHTATIESMQDPKPKGDEIIVAVAAASLNPHDTKVLAGEDKDLFPISFPYIPGSDFSGTVVELGPQAEGFSIGDRVGGVVTKGALAERVAISSKSSMLAHLPEGLDPETAAAVPVVGLTAQAIIDVAKLSQGQSVLIIGAPGGVGAITTQLAAKTGARVIATASHKQESFIRDCGASEVIDYQNDGLEQSLRRLAPGGVDVLVDLVNVGPELLESAKMVRNGGTLISVLFGPNETEFHHRINLVYIRLGEKPPDLSKLYRMIAGGSLRVDISQRFSLENAEAGLQALQEKGIHGKIIITTPNSHVKNHFDPTNEVR